MSRTAGLDPGFGSRPRDIAVERRAAVLFVGHQVAFGWRPHNVGQLQKGLLRQLGDIVACEGDGQGLGLQALAAAQRTIGGQHKLQHPLAHLGAFGVGQGVF